jgi:60 kDa SS-A/Ro ribonucleoprotein
MIASRLADPAAIAKARVFPYQLLATARAADTAIPAIVRRALEDAMELAIANVPAIDGQVYVCPDVSASMRSPITGVRRGATTAVRCVDVAALFAAAILRRNATAEVLPFDWAVLDLTLSPRDTVMTNAQRLAAIGGGGTAISAPLAALNARKAQGDLVVIVSDNQSWADATGGPQTPTMAEWNRFRARNPNARLVLLDLQPSPTMQTVDRADVLNIGGFSDQVFSVVAAFAAGRLNGDRAMNEINAVAV